MNSTRQEYLELGQRLCEIQNWPAFELFLVETGRIYLRRKEDKERRRAGDGGQKQIFISQLRRDYNRSRRVIDEFDQWMKGRGRCPMTQSWFEKGDN